LVMHMSKEVRVEKKEEAKIFLAGDSQKVFQSVRIVEVKKVER